VKRALVSGDCGFVGKHMRRALEERGYAVLGLDIVHGDTEDIRSWLRADTDGIRWDLVVHCAAIVGGRQSIEGAPLMIAQNLGIDAELFNWAARTRQKRIVYFSSSAAYPTYLQSEAWFANYRLKENDIRWDHISAPDETYGWAKLTGEMLADYAQEMGIRVHTFRPFSGYGEDQSIDYPFPAFAKRAVEHESPFTIWGGQQTRDFIHIEDIIRGVFAAIEEDYPGPLNLCTGRGIDFKTLAEMFCPSVPIRAKFDKPQGVHRRVGDPTEMNKVYVPRITLEEGIDRALKGFR